MSEAVVTPPVPTRAEPKPRSLWQTAWRRLLRKPAVVISMLYILLLLMVAVFAPQVARYDYQAPDYQLARANPFTPGHILGTDELGRDILSRLIYGARISMAVAFGVAGIQVGVGILLGLLAGYFGGLFSSLVMRLTDIVFSFPELLLAILIMGIRGPGVGNIFFALGVVAWPGTCRLVRGQVLAVKELEYVLAARSLGQSDLKIMFRHLLPNILSPVIVSATLGIANWILAEASLSFLGIGVKPPYPSWGGMVNQMLSFVYSQPVLLVAPSVTIALTVMAFNFLGDGLRDALDPRLKQ